METVAYKNLVIYYFSGTGNARQTALWIGDEAQKMGVSCQIINIDHLKKSGVHIETDSTLIGFCAPTHGFNFAPVMLKFLWNFPSGKDTSVFIINTRAGMKLSKLFLPGLGGLAQYFAALVLKAKGYRIKGMQPMDLPSNWISLHPGLKAKVVNSIFERCERISRKFARKMLWGKSTYKALLSLPVDLVVSPLAIGYYLFGRFAISKTFVATENCTNCGKCANQCPVNAIQTIDQRPYWTFSCESCMRCMNNCPERAIETTHTFTFVFWWLILSFIAPLFISRIFEQSTWISDQSIPGIFFDIFTWLIGLFLLWVAYRVLHKLMRFKIFDRLVAFTSFTHYKFWRRYKAPNPSDKNLS